MPKRYDSNVAKPPAPSIFVAPSVASVIWEVNKETPGFVHEFADIIRAVDSGKLKLEDHLKGLRAVIAPNGIAFLQIRSVESYSSSFDSEEEGKGIFFCY